MAVAAAIPALTGALGNLRAEPAQTTRKLFQGAVVFFTGALVAGYAYGWYLHTKEGEPDATRTYDTAAPGWGGSEKSAGEAPSSSGGVPKAGASKQEVASYFAAEAKRAGLPPELPVMTSLVESELQTGPAVRYKDHDSAGPFQIRVQLHGWKLEDAESYETSLKKWFIVNANRYKGQYPSTAAGLGAWCQRVQGSAFPDRYAARYSEAKSLVS